MGVGFFRPNSETYYAEDEEENTFDINERALGYAFRAEGNLRQDGGLQITITQVRYPTSLTADVKPDQTLAERRADQASVAFNQIAEHFGRRAKYITWTFDDEDLREKKLKTDHQAVEMVQTSWLAQQAKRLGFGRPVILFSDKYKGSIIALTARFYRE